ncbi:hypothetical protein [Desulforamulus aeronauticus]|uniref:Vitamin B12 dependent methionine synthase, activation domain n=1 Tax=Desulforamulus aeronauticus DSM 10349 TaxID=1121421 RepID=A0A1M6PY49_9FIRM|nr:hypothetical protein [Desulforamulus aeronauticus]SHK12915.1 hypothetical protein SAMN02745123_00789 [Desulforamulus aeronauticus DSM 10349]
MCINTENTLIGCFFGISENDTVAGYGVILSRRGEVVLFAEIPIAIDPQQVLRYMGQPVNKQSQELQQQIGRMVQGAKHLVYPRAVCNDCTIPPQFFLSPAISSTLHCCKTASVIAVTVGKAIEDEVNRLFKVKEPTAGLATDALGTVAVEEAAQWVLAGKARQQRLRGLYATAKIGPGYPGVDLLQTSRFLTWAGAEQIGLTSDEYGQMHPKKSLVFLVGWSHQPTLDGHKCKQCHNHSCYFRHAPQGNYLDIG